MNMLIQVCVLSEYELFGTHSSVLPEPSHMESSGVGALVFH